MGPAPSPAADHATLLRLIHQRAHEPDGSPRDALFMALDELNDEELGPVAYKIRRNLDGRREYGPLDLRRDRRKWLSEIKAELSDAVDYIDWCEQQDALDDPPA
jgi:hypothetical protein